MRVFEPFYFSSVPAQIPDSKNVADLAPVPAPKPNIKPGEDF
jgi:hypothetical protein